MSVLLLIIGFVLLVKCADFFVDGCSSVAKALGIPSLIIGLTIVAFGTSAPEAAVSVTASLKGMNTISLGNVVGSNLCNLLLVLGFSGLFGTLVAKRKVITRDFVYAIFSSIVLFILAVGFFKDGGEEGIITRTNGLILLCFLAVYLYALLTDALRTSRKNEEKEKFEIKNIAYIILGVAGIILGGQLVVDNAVTIARELNVSENVIALTIVAIGTSLPELVTSTVAAKKGEVDLAIGNVIGSNIFNVLFILGLASSISPITYGIDSFYDIVIMLGVSIFVYILILNKGKIGKGKALILLAIYASYMAYILIR